MNLVEDRVLSVKESSIEGMNVSIYYKTQTILLDNNYCSNYFLENYQFILSGPWKMFAVTRRMSRFLVI